jgi:hypothetical protein
VGLPLNRTAFARAHGVAMPLGYCAGFISAGVRAAVVLPVLLAVAPSAFAQSGASGARMPLVRHTLKAALGFAPDTPDDRRHDGDGPVLTLKVRISDHAPDSDFFGVIQTQFKGAAFGAAPKAIWADNGCHHDRGLPKITVIGISGKIPARKTDAQGPIDVSAVPRHIGKLVPEDEIVVQRIVPEAGQNLGSSGSPGLSLEAQTKMSRLKADLQLIVTRCGP